MTHEMRLNNEPFELIKNGTKTIEMRLYDEKRRLIHEKDLIIFINRTTNEEIITEVKHIYTFDSFEELYKHFDKVSLGYNIDEAPSPQDMMKYYSIEEQEKYGVVGIEIRLVK